jgi:hypothetical protein
MKARRNKRLTAIVSWAFKIIKIFIKIDKSNRNTDKRTVSPDSKGFQLQRTDTINNYVVKHALGQH